MSHACRACGADLAAHQTVVVRGEPVQLFSCPACGLYEFPDPTWLDAAYRDPIADIDVGLAERCQTLATIVETIVRAQRVQDQPLLDFGGGYGLLTRLVRNTGLQMVHHDPMAANLFAQGFEGTTSAPYALCTMVEVFEHLTEPRKALEELRHIDLLLISTELVPPGLTDLSSWHYLIPDLGQHVTFYARRSLEVLATEFGYQLATNGWGLHLFHRGRLSRTARTVLTKHRLAAATAVALRRLQHGKSLQEQDAAATRGPSAASSGG